MCWSLNNLEGISDNIPSHIAVVIVVYQIANFSKFANYSYMQLTSNYQFSEESVESIFIFSFLDFFICALEKNVFAYLSCWCGC